MKSKELIIFLGALALVGGILVLMSAFISWAPSQDFSDTDFYQSRIYVLPVIGLLILLAGIGCVAGRAGAVTGVVLTGLGLIVLLLAIAISSQIDRVSGRPGFQVGFWLAMLGAGASAITGYLVLKVSRKKKPAPDE